ncbi:MAG: aminodeoxychorismate/anthranilate synthase component II [Eubacterium sp.]|jgi:anthranilate synthase component 2|nr:aminodeoxychorismate/anthranilate synthase component II [Eubacterium sp.]
MIILIDNYDSFSYNLYQLIGEIKTDVKVFRNDEMSVDKISELSPERIVISPGPGKPSEAGICVDLIRNLYKKIPILGICLGHQAIFEAFGGTVSYADKLFHGKSSEVNIDTQNDIFKGLPSRIQAARYHSLTGKIETLPSALKITAQTDDKEIMAVSHKIYPVYGVQFHPESILTPHGKVILENFLNIVDI